MKANWKGYLENILFVLNILLIFLLVFENQIDLPWWFQPIGRFHPLVLHFPIGLLGLVFIVLLFKSKWPTEHFNLYEKLINFVLLLASILAGFSAIMGLFLSLELGYDPQLLELHKFSGAAILFVSSLLYWARSKSWLTLNFNRIGAAAGLFALTLGGHEGASITHGEGYLLDSFFQKSKESVVFEEALLFDDLVLPIFEQKCISCHNTRKAKGELILTSMKTLLKGGKSGDLFVSGHPEKSTLMERVFLPLDDEEHMPPSGKTQLTSDEIAIFTQWIKHNAEAQLKVASLSPSDSLYVLGKKMLTPKVTEEVFEFKEADPKKIAELNNAYRVIQPIAQHSPALDVAFFGAKEFTSEKLGDLLALKEQIVSLNLNKIPVTDEDLKTIAKLVNLRELTLNFSNVSGKGLLEMSEMKELKKVSISGIDINITQLESLLNKQKSIEKITVWNTHTNENELSELRKKFSDKDIVSGRKGLDDLLIQLNEPFVANKSAIFKDSIVLDLGHPIKGVEMRIDLKNQSIDSINSTIYSPNKVVIKQSTAFVAKAYKKGWLASEQVVLNVYQNKYEPDTVMLLTKLNRVHPASGSQTFFDKVLGKNGANNPAWANNWAGFKDNDMVLMIQYDKAVPVSNISLNLLIESETSIFPPESIEIWGGNDPNKLKLLTKVRPLQPTERLKGYIHLVNCSFQTFNGKYFKVVARPLQAMPAWKSKKGQPALFLVDELFVN